MDLFLPGQRYTSEGEPELGIGVVLETNKGRVQVFFPVAEETRMYSADNAPLLRVVFKPGDTIVDIQNQSISIEQVEVQDGLYIYHGNGTSISEVNLGEVRIDHTVEDRLLQGDTDTPEQFALRRETLFTDYSRRTSPVNGFVGGRIDLIPHQLYIAHEVSNRYAPRVLLSDQVGLGKTIEACLILHRLLQNGRISRVLILVPDSLVHQWFVEVLRRFNLWFNIFDEERCEALDEGAPDGNPFLDNQLVLCSIDFLANSAQRARQALTADWDMLIVDEAHHLEWSLEHTSPEYALVELLSKTAKALLLLTATPEQLGAESHFARLRLLDPDRYSDFENFKNEPSNTSEIASIIEKLSSGESLQTQESKSLKKLISKEQFDSINDALKTNDIIEDLLDQHGPGRVLFRNTRAAMQDFPKRLANLVSITPTEDQTTWIERLKEEFLYDLGEHSGKPKHNFDTDPRVKWLIQTVKKLENAKVLLICKTKQKVLALERSLKQRTNIKVGIFHEDLTIVQRDRNAAWFADPNGAQVLLCSEIGSEGRNFQFAHHLVLFDLPFHPELLEQRIGRLDRIGQKQDIHIHIPTIKDTPQEQLAYWYHKGLNAFEENIEGGDQISKLFGSHLLQILSSNANTNKEIDTIIQETAKYQKELKVTLSEGRDRLLEMNSFRPKVAEELIHEIQKADTNTDLELYLKRVFYQFDIDMDSFASRSYKLRPSVTNLKYFPAIPAKGMVATFERERALSHEDVDFITWDHPLTSGAIDMVLSTGMGNTSFGILPKTGKQGLIMELLFVLETSGEHAIDINKFLPNTPIRVVVDHTGTDITDNVQAQDLSNIIKGDLTPLLDNETFTESILPNMIKTGTDIAENRSISIKDTGLQSMNKTLSHEIERLKTLSKSNTNIRPEEIQIAIKEQSLLSKIIDDARLRLDAMMIIQKQ